MRRVSSLAFLLAAAGWCAAPTPAAAVNGTLSGTVADAQGRPVAGAQVSLENKLSGYRQVVRTDAEGRYTLFNLPADTYHLEVQATGFAAVHRSITLSSGLPLRQDLALAPESSATVVVEDKVDLVEESTASHLDIDKSTIEQSPAAVQSRALENVLLTTPGFIQDENGRFHFRGSHGQVMYVVDGVPVTDQVQATFSNSMDPAQVDTMEVITGGVSAEYGGKPGAVVSMTTKSGLGTPDGFEGDVYLGASRFSTYEGGFSARGGNDAFGYFVTGAASSSDRFLDPVVFQNLHNQGSTGRIFGRFDWVLGGSDTLRLTASGGRTDRDVVNLPSQEAAGQDQRVHNTDANVSLAWTHLFDAYRSLEATVYLRGSGSDLDPTQELQEGFTGGGPDTPYWAQQHRTLGNQGALLAYTQQNGGNTLKAGIQYARYPIHEQFSYAITDPTLITDPADPNYPFTPAGGGHLFRYDDTIAPTLTSGFIQDELKAGGWDLSMGLRYDIYHLRDYTQSQWQPRLGAAYRIPGTGTVLRASYDRLMITPENEGLAFSTSQYVWTATSGLNTPVAQLRPELQDSFLVGVEQQLGSFARLSLDYWWKNSTNAADNSQFLNTGVLFPIAAAKGRFHGLDLRLDTVPMAGWSGYLSAGTVRTVYFDPTVGGLDAAGTANDTLPYLIDHDQKLTLQAGLRYEHGGFFGQVIGRYDSGLVAGDPTGISPSDPDYGFGLGYIHLVHDSLGDIYRVDPRTIWNLAFGQTFHLKGRQSLEATLDVLNVFDKSAVYNFLSVFGGTHVYPPRTVAVGLKYRF